MAEAEKETAGGLLLGGASERPTLGKVGKTLGGRC